MPHAVYVVFFAPPRFITATQLLSYYYFAPFVHVELAWNPFPLIATGRDKSMSIQEARSVPNTHMRFTTITGELGKVVTGFRKFGSNGYCWVRIMVSTEQFVALNNTALHMDGRDDTYFSWVSFMRCGTPFPCAKPTIEQRSWFCSQLITFLLQRIGVFGVGLNASSVHPTELFLMLMALPLGCESVKRPMPFPAGELPGDPRTPTEVYLDAQGLTPDDGKVPIEEIKRVRVYIEERFNAAIRRERGRSRNKTPR